MAYELLITPKIDAGEKFKAYLKDNEIVRGESFKLVLEVKNVGRNTFPGGIVKKVQIEFGQGATWDPGEIEIGRLEPESSTLIRERTFPARNIGIGWIRVPIEASDKEKIEFYQYPGVKIEGEWIYPIYGVSREELTIIKLLEELIAKYKSQT